LRERAENNVRIVGLGNQIIECNEIARKIHPASILLLYFLQCILIIWNRVTLGQILRLSRLLKNSLVRNARYANPPHPDPVISLSTPPSISSLDIAVTSNIS
jgi:hypothetical protein